MQVIYRPHLKLRIKQRNFPESYPKRIYKNARNHYFDTKMNRYIAVSRLKYADGLRNLAIAYDILGRRIEIVTIYPVSDKELRSKIRTGRWEKR